MEKLLGTGKHRSRPEFSSLQITCHRQSPRDRRFELLHQEPRDPAEGSNHYARKQPSRSQSLLTAIRAAEVLRGARRIAHGVLAARYFPLDPPYTSIYADRRWRLGQGNSIFFTDSDVVAIAEKHNATPAQVTMSWLVQRGIPPIAKSANVERMKQNMTVSLPPF